MDVRGLWLVVALAGCGRIGFDGDARPPDADLAKVCGPAYQPVVGLTSRYRVVSRSAEWQEAEQDCELDGGHLGVPDDPFEEAWLFDQARGWIGVSDHASEGTFRTVIGDLPAYTSWDDVEPNNIAGDEDCVEIRVNRKWNDSGCGVGRAYVCECDGAPLPSPPVWCDTRQIESCGTCSNQCPGGATCVNQICAIEAR